MGQVNKEELPPCFGTPMKECGRKRNPMLKGFDNEWRCGSCHDIHVELVYKESGDVNPNTGKPRFVPAVVDPVARQRAIDTIMKAVDSDEPVIHMPNHLRGQKEWTNSNKAIREVAAIERKNPIPQDTPEHRSESAARREAVLAKYGVKKG